MPIPDYTSKDVKRFWSKIDESGGEDACWNWQASLDSWGYGQMGWGRKLRLAHRIAYELTFGVYDETLHVLHHCDNPRCCNPRHLFLGTNLDNVRDKIAKGRQPDTHGEKNPNAKLTDEQVTQIRDLFASGTHTASQLASMFAVSSTHIYRICKRQMRG